MGGGAGAGKGHIQKPAFIKNTKINFSLDPSDVLTNICPQSLASHAARKAQSSRRFHTGRLEEMLLECKLLISSVEDKERKYLSQNAVYNMTHNKNNPEHFRRVPYFSDFY